MTSAAPAASPGPDLAEPQLPNKRHKRPAPDTSESSASATSDSSTSTDSSSEDDNSKKRVEQASRHKRSKSAKKKKHGKEKDVKKKKHKKKKSRKEKKSRRSHGEDEGGPVQLSKFLRDANASSGTVYSAVSGKKIKMKLQKSKADKVAEKNREQLLAFLNSSYD